MSHMAGLNSSWLDEVFKLLMRKKVSHAINILLLKPEHWLPSVL